LVKNSIRRCERFRFDFYLQSCSVDTLGKRCEALMRSAERELLEIEKKKQAADQHSAAAATAAAGSAAFSFNPARGGQVTVTTAGSNVEVAKEKLAEMTRQITEEAKKLANARAQLTKAKYIPGSLAAAAAGGSGSAANMKAFLDSASSSSVTAATASATAAAASTAVTGANGGTGAGGKDKVNRGGSTLAAAFPEGFYPELCKYEIVVTLIRRLWFIRFSVLLL
jgi:hypothetical protein